MTARNDQPFTKEERERSTALASSIYSVLDAEKAPLPVGSLALVLCCAQAAVQSATAEPGIGIKVFIEWYGRAIEAYALRMWRDLLNDDAC